MEGGREIDTSVIGRIESARDGRDDDDDDEPFVDRFRRE